MACTNFLSDISQPAMETEEKINKWDYQTKKFSYSKGNHQQSKKTTHRMGEHIC